MPVVARGGSLRERCAVIAGLVLAAAEVCTLRNTMQQAFLRINFVRDELQQLQAVTAHCVKCGEERAPVVTSIDLGSVRVRCPICQSSSELTVSKHDGSRLPWA